MIFFRSTIVIVSCKKKNFEVKNHRTISFVSVSKFEVRSTDILYPLYLNDVSLNRTVDFHYKNCLNKIKFSRTTIDRLKIYIDITSFFLLFFLKITHDDLIILLIKSIEVKVTHLPSIVDRSIDLITPRVTKVLR